MKNTLSLFKKLITYRSIITTPKNNVNQEVVNKTYNLCKKINNYIINNISVTSTYKPLKDVMHKNRLQTYETTFKGAISEEKIMEVQSMFHNYCAMEDIKNTMEKHSAGNCIDQSKLLNYLIQKENLNIITETYITNPDYFPDIHAMSMIFVLDKNQQPVPILTVDPFLGIDPMTIDQSLKFYSCGAKEVKDYILKIRINY